MSESNDRNKMFDKPSRHSESWRDRHVCTAIPDVCTIIYGPRAADSMNSRAILSSMYGAMMLRSGWKARCRCIRYRLEVFYGR
jgi:hypothetical protein